MSDKDWVETHSLGETHFQVTALHVSRFLQAIGNDGLLMPPTALPERTTRPRQRPRNPTRTMEEVTAKRLRAAMLDVVQRGTATSVAHAFANSGWQIGGKTGSGVGPVPDPNPRSLTAGLLA